MGKKKPKTPELSYPDLLSEAGKKHWDTIIRVLGGADSVQAIDTTALVLLCDAIAQYLECRELVSESGVVAYTDKGVAFQHPAVGAMNKAHEKVVKLCREFGLTPAARSKNQTTTDKPTVNDNKAKFIARIVG